MSTQHGMRMVTVNENIVSKYIVENAIVCNLTNLEEYTIDLSCDKSWKYTICVGDNCYRFNDRHVFLQVYRDSGLKHSTEFIIIRFMMGEYELIKVYNYTDENNKNIPAIKAAFGNEILLVISPYKTSFYVEISTDKNKVVALLKKHTSPDVIPINVLDLSEKLPKVFKKSAENNVEYMFLLNKVGSKNIVIGFTSSKYDEFKNDKKYTNFRVVFWEKVNVDTKSKLLNEFAEGLDGHIITHKDNLIDIQAWFIENIKSEKLRLTPIPTLDEYYDSMTPPNNNTNSNFIFKVGHSVARSDDVLSDDVLRDSLYGWH
jgi:hypothetical protein